MAKNRFDARIVLRAQEGDREARELLLRRLQGVLRAFFIRRLGRHATVDDMVQNTLIRVHNGLKSLRDPEKFKAFAMKAALFELHDYYRGRHSPREVLYDPSEMSGVTRQSMAWAGSNIDLQRALSILTPHAQRILELREYGYRYKEIAAILGTTERAVKMQVKRAFDKMRKAFATGPE